MSIKVFFIEPTDRRQTSLRRYHNSKVHCEASGCGYHNAHTPIEDTPDGDASVSFGSAAEAKAWDDRWPTHCPCGYEFTDADEWQLFGRTIYRRPDTGEEMTLHDALVGACWNAHWLADRGRYCGPDGRSLVVKTPGGEWTIDSRASNCTMPDDTVHRCWVRHGRPEDGTLHVDKNGHTCAAGAGSIAMPGYHGFLHNGHLTEC